MMAIPYALYKNPMQLDTLAIVQYLHYKKISLRPTVIFERNFPENVTELPTIISRGIVYSGLGGCIRFYENMTGIDDIYEKAIKFKIANPKYTIGS
jgi:hypothetical protein